jgi:hypothetical protein
MGKSKWLESDSNLKPMEISPVKCLFYNLMKLGLANYQKHGVRTNNEYCNTLIIY